MNRFLSVLVFLVPLVSISCDFGNPAQVQTDTLVIHDTTKVYTDPPAPGAPEITVLKSTYLDDFCAYGACTQKLYIEVQWNKVAGALGYRGMMSIGQSDSWSLAFTVGPVSIEYTEPPDTAFGQIVKYKVCAVNSEGGNGPFSPAKTLFLTR